MLLQTDRACGLGVPCEAHLHYFAEGSGVGQIPASLNLQRCLSLGDEGGAVRGGVPQGGTKFGRESKTVCKSGSAGDSGVLDQQV